MVGPFFVRQMEKQKKLLLWNGSTVRVDLILMQDKCENAVEGDTNIIKKIVNLVKFNKWAGMNLILYTNSVSSVRNVAFEVVQVRLVNKFAPQTILSLLKLKSKFFSSKGLRLEALLIWMTKFGFKGNITDKVFMIHILDNLHKGYYVILDSFKNCLTSAAPNALMIEVICKSWKHKY